MNLLTKNLIKISAGAGLCFAGGLLTFNNEAKAEGECASSGNLTERCYITPATYKITVYEMGLCTSDPLAGTYINASDEVVTDNTIDESTCTPSFKNDNGFEVDLAGGASQALTGTNFRPPVGTYPSAYIKIKNQFGLKGTHTLGGTPYYSKDDGVATTNSGLYDSWNENLMDFGNGPTCNGTSSSREMAGSEVFTTGATGTMKAVLATVNSGTYVGTTQANCANSTRMYGVFAPTVPVVITDDTQGLEVTFTITNRGMTIIPNSNVPAAFSSGPFSPSFKTY